MWGTARVEDDAALSDKLRDPSYPGEAERAILSRSKRGTSTARRRLFEAAKGWGFGVFIFPHYLYTYDQGCRFGGAVERMMLEGKEFFRPASLSLRGFPGSGAD